MPHFSVSCRERQLRFDGVMLHLPDQAERQVDIELFDVVIRHIVRLLAS